MELDANLTRAATAIVTGRQPLVDTSPEIPRRCDLDSMSAGLLALGSSDWPRLLPDRCEQFRERPGMASATIVPDYSGGTAMDLHHLPFRVSQRRRPTPSNIHLSTEPEMSDRRY